MIILDQPREVAAWVGTRLDSDLFRVWSAIGLVRRGELVGGGILHNWSKYDMELSYFGVVTAGMVRALMESAKAAEVARVTVRIARRNKRLGRGLEKLGFRWEGIQRRLYGTTKADDALMYGLMLDTRAVRRMAA